MLTAVKAMHPAGPHSGEDRLMQKPDCTPASSKSILRLARPCRLLVIALNATTFQKGRSWLFSRDEMGPAFTMR